MKSIAVFCGSSFGFSEQFKDQAYLLGKAIAENNMQIVYGGANVGLMGSVADGALDHGGKVIGVLPFFLQNKELAHKGLTDLILVESMHERKLKMHEYSDAVISLPGGYGTLEELFEMTTWGQLGLHKKPIGILNTNGYYNELLAFLNTAVKKGFLKEDYRKMLLDDENINDLLEKMNNYTAPETGKWISKETT
jgi:uncharacterized protein (TIGR00730 family)